LYLCTLSNTKSNSYYIVLNMRIIFLLVIACFSSLSLWGQDLHFAQFYNHPTLFNPAQTGIFKGNLRGSAHYRSQWESVPVSFRTFAVAVDGKLIRRKLNVLASGFQLAQDQAGDASLKWTQINWNTSVIHALGKYQAISVGFGIGMAQRSFDISNLSFKNQWTGDVFDSGLPSKENFNTKSGLKPTLSVGLNWHYSSTENRTRINIGAGASHLNRPDIGFQDAGSLKLNMRSNLLIDGTFQMTQSFDLVGYGLIQQMTKAQEIVVGAGAKVILSEQQGNDLAVQASVGLRPGDAIIPAFQLYRNEWTLGLSYDWNISKYQIATNHRGGFEISVIYRTLPVAPMKTFKTCPIF
jgi:type IX secretion system PorP/SprF family membrane protein